MPGWPTGDSRVSPAVCGRGTPQHLHHAHRFPGQVDVTTEVSAGRLGLLNTAQIARRHGISVELPENPTGGTTALVVVPNALLVMLAPPVHAAAGPMAQAAPLPASSSRRRRPPAPTAKSWQTSRMNSSHLLSMASVNALRRYLVTNAKWTCRLQTT